MVELDGSDPDGSDPDGDDPDGDDPDGDDPDGDDPDGDDPHGVDESSEPGWQTAPGETPIDPSGLRSVGVTTRSELNTVEAENIRKAFVKYFVAKPSKRTAPFTETWVCKLHQEMFGDVWEWAGEYRKRDLNFGDSWQQVPQNLSALLEDLKVWETSGMELLEQAVRLHHRAVTIHPFFNGNGRWGRLLANIWLRQHDHPLIRWPDKLTGTQSPIRDDYFAALKKADRGDYGPLIALHRAHDDSRGDD